MQIAKDRVVTIEYTLKDQTGTVLDSSDEGEPYHYLHGSGHAILPALERALEGKSMGEAFNVKLSPAEAFGERDEALQTTLPRDRFEDEELEVGMRFRSDDDDDPEIVTVVAIDAETVTVDGNHPLAGRALSFEGAILLVREATAEEISHGHAHDGDGHGHDGHGHGHDGHGHDA